ncbi:hypothetical protein GCM10010112_11870 [Actinoplanes lobatus]|uniref:Uncharacterized protein n=1 Tax=Actinoplanes lobatus TaxID=113568 RepID=A0ABQ4A8W1_9ACTN|nr:hypothetical protein GCM10010112_11870 [Actinoplanes lobatus]GIE37447.1 hypothetical protein Alo02nite_03450 [Actinoplanes lobatus]
MSDRARHPSIERSSSGQSNRKSGPATHSNSRYAATAAGGASAGAPGNASGGPISTGRPDSAAAARHRSTLLRNSSSIPIIVVDGGNDEGTPAAR